MKNLFSLLALLMIGLRLSAQTAAPVRLAIISESPDALTVADVLTAQLTGHKDLQLLERNEIDKVYHEQSLSAGNRDYLKLGKILGADGLLLFEVIKTKQATNLMTRLIAVKPGVVLVAEKYSWPIEKMSGWSPSFARHLDIFLPKLAVLVKDVIPISVVNLRSAVNSVDALEAELQLKVLTIQRLTREPSLFVLERQKMQLLTREKDLKVDDSAFWNGSYLLEGVMDQNGYTKDTITINARMTPPKGGAPVLFEVSGPRANLSEVINQLIAKVNEVLKIKSTMKEWNAVEEAAQYFAEAKWAFDWAVLEEAQSAVESAWALGKTDQECAVLRIRVYMEQLPEVMLFPDPLYKSVIWRGRHRLADVKDAPDPKNCDIALVALRYYEESCRAVLAGLQRSNLETNQFEPEWYRLGIEVLNASSGVLWNFHQFPELQEPVRKKLAELRLGARTVAKLIANLPMSHGGNYDGQYFPSESGFSNLRDFKTDLAIFECMVKWGCFWQDRPEDTVALYRELMTMPPFMNGMMGLWPFSAGTPRLAVWSPEDRNRASTIWRAFQDELGASTNYLIRLQVKGLVCAYAKTEEMLECERSWNGGYPAQDRWENICKELLNYISDNYETIVAGNENLYHHDWGIRSVLSEYVATRYASKFDLIQRNNREKLKTRRHQDEVDSIYAKQLNYLKEKKPYEFFEFASLFNGVTCQEYSKKQVLELLPWMIAYKSNLVAQSQSDNGASSRRNREAIIFISTEKKILNRILQAPQPTTPAQAIPQVAVSSVLTNAMAAAPAIQTLAPNNITVVKRFCAIPAEILPPNAMGLRFPYISAHHWVGEKLLLDCGHMIEVDSYNEKTKKAFYRYQAYSDIAIFDPATEHWDVITGPITTTASENRFYHRTTLLHGNLFTCEGKQIRKYDFKNRRWQVLSVSDGNDYELFAVNDRLYAANESIIFEILDDGKSTRILASTRRNPPVSKLDRESLGTPILYEGPNHSLRLCTSSKIFTWTGKDWQEDFAGPLTGQPECFDEGIIFRSVSDTMSEYSSSGLSWLAMGENSPKLCFFNDPQLPRRTWVSPYPSGLSARTQSAKPNSLTEKPLWALASGVIAANMPAALHESNLFLLSAHYKEQKIVDKQRDLVVRINLLPQDGYHAELLCFSRDLPSAQKIFLKFEAPSGYPPVAGMQKNHMGMGPPIQSAWMYFTTNFLILGSARIPIGDNYQIGVWLLELSKIRPDIAAQKQVQREQNVKDMAAAEQIQKVEAQQQAEIDQQEAERRRNLLKLINKK
ncbi:MAG: hypothetical protein WCS94_02365 [Verrucomicrobiota bacterium]